MVADSESGTGLPLSQILGLLKNFGSPDERQKYESHGPFLCPCSPRIANNIDFRLSQISDCAVISTEVSPAGAINLISFCWGIAMRFLQRGILCRGHITRGHIYHSADQFIGTGYQNAYAAESNVSLFQRGPDDKGTPFIEVDNDFCQYIKDSSDACVKEMFGRLTRSDGEGVAIFPFQRLQHSFLIAGLNIKFDPNKEREANGNVRKWIKTMKENVLSFADARNPKAMRKIEHYIEALDAQLAACDETDKFIDKLCQPFPTRPF
jgi:hypothetical protein